VQPLGYLIRVLPEEIKFGGLKKRLYLCCMKNISKELNRINFIDSAFKIIEEDYIPKQFGDACELNETLNKFYELEEASQVGVQLTAQISHSFYCFLKYHANKIFEVNNSFLRVKTTRKNDNEKVSYDLILIDINSNELYYIEVKLSQNNNSWQGSTSSTSKVDIFLLINFKIDRDKILTTKNNKNLFTGVFASIVNMKDKKWLGVAKNNSHRTKFEFRLDEWDIDFIKKNLIIKGDVIPKKIIAHIKNNPIDYGND